MSTSESSFAFVTLLNSSSYLPGALVLAHSLRELHPHPRKVEFQTACLVTPETVDVESIKQLRSAFDVVIGVEVITSGAEGQAGLQLMGRPDLHSALTKLHIFRLGEKFTKVVYLDADVLPLRSLSHLFQLPNRFSACPDSGWPDCFNSGVMVFEPDEADFKGMMELMESARKGDNELEGLGIGSGNGSFDGADQGLLNEWFSEEGGGGDWNRLSFTYNVTPSAAYQYAPAYRRYGSKIYCVHFIGNNKPWRSIITRPARAPAPDLKDLPFDYPSLVDRWFAVYDRHMRPLGQSLPSATFSVPQNVAVWNQPAFATREGRAQINEMGEESGSEVSATALALRAATNQSGSTEGIYISLPLDGRIDLMRPQPIRPASNTPEAQPSLATSPPIYAQEFGNTAPVHPPSRQGSPPISDTWNAQYNSPPRQSGPQYGEMRGGMPENYENAWDKPLGHQKQVDAWNAVEEYPTIPNVVKEDRWYAGAADGKPDYNKVSTVFPWENKERAPPARHFPASDPPPPKSANVPALRIQLPSPPVLEELASNKSMMSPFGHGKKPMTFNQAMSGYTNAWDIPSIQQYAHRLAGPKERKALAKGMQTPALERENAQGILLSEQHDGKQKSKRPFGKRSRRQSTTDNAEATSEGSRDGDDEETTSSSEDEDEGRHPIIRRGAAGSSGSKSHSRTTSKVSAAVTHGSNPGSPLSPVGSKQYQTRSVQTESPSMQDQVVQFPSPENELTPLAKHTVIALANSARPSAVRMSSEETVTSATYSSPGANIKTPSGGEEGQSAESSTKARPTQRVFDPATSIDARRRDTVEVLSRFMRQATTGASAQNPGTL